MRITFAYLPSVTLALASMNISAVAAHEDEAKAIKAITKSGGYVTTETRGDVNKFVAVQFVQSSDVDKILTQIKYLPDLDMIMMGANLKMSVTDKHIETLSGYQNIKYLDINCKNTITDDGLKSIGNLRKLEVLRFRNTLISDAGMKELAHLQELREFWLFGSPNLTSAGYQQLAGLRKLESLWCTEKITDEALKGVGKITSLQSLILMNSNVTDKGLKEVGNLVNLEKLLLQKTGITDSGLKHLTKLGKLHTLNLGLTKITDDGLTSIGSLANLKNLYLTGTNIGDAGLGRLTALQKLELLDLARTKISDPGLIQLGVLQNLKEVNIQKTNVTKKGPEQLRRLRKGIIINR